MKPARYPKLDIISLNELLASAPVGSMDSPEMHLRSTLSYGRSKL
jgi:hypothetical protein